MSEASPRLQRLDAISSRRDAKESLSFSLDIIPKVPSGHPPDHTGMPRWGSKVTDTAKHSLNNRYILKRRIGAQCAQWRTLLRRGVRHATPETLHLFTANVPLPPQDSEEEDSLKYKRFLADQVPREAEDPVSDASTLANLAFWDAELASRLHHDGTASGSREMISQRNASGIYTFSHKELLRLCECIDKLRRISVSIARHIKIVERLAKTHPQRWHERHEDRGVFPKTKGLGSPLAESILIDEEWPASTEWGMAPAKRVRKKIW
ncbi:hypothetical protein FZEAL_5190 [Fusarium zealandicum]|uniref:Uncharacterized protein n=1 Tax=Fusarium zealandicum TaxID=1053134 RepID=A0A8H4UK78_9HYPO|nr:hypothetical protein FZEAL_5190 [Fusarium zealandicum]